MLLPQTALVVDGMVAAAQARGRAPSLVAAVFRDGEVEHVAAAGEPAGPDTQFRLGSITKTFTAALVLRLRDEGHLALDDLLYRHLPGTPLGGVTLRQLLSHTSGLQREPDGDWWERAAGPDLDAFLDALGPDKIAYPPLRGHHYSNLAYGLLGAVVTRVTGDDWASALAKRLLEPLGMARTTYHPDEPFARGYVVHPWHGTPHEEPRHDTGAMAPAGQLWSTAADLARWGRFLADPDPAVLAPATVAEMCAPVAMRDLDAWTNGHGLGLELWRRGERVFVGHAGSMPGYLATLAVYRPGRVGVAAFANAYTLRGTTIADLAGRVLSAVCDHEPARVEPWLPSAAPPQDVVPVTGRWWWMGREYEIAWDGDLLVRPLDGPGGAGGPGEAPWRRPVARARRTERRRGTAGAARRVGRGRGAGPRHNPAHPLSCPAVTKSINRSIALISGVSRSLYVRTDARMRRHMSAGSATPSAAQTPSFQGRPGAITGHARIPTRAGLTACQMSTYGCPVTSTSGDVTEATIRLSFEPATRWSTSTPSRRRGPGSKSRTAATRSSMPDSGSTTTPSTRRSSPQTRSTRAASCRPSTQIRLARATRAGADGTATEPEAVSLRGAGAPCPVPPEAPAGARRSVTTSPSSRNAAGSSGKFRRLPRRSSSTTAPASNPTTAPQNPDSASSTTSSGVASTSGTTRRGRRARSTSSPYTRLRLENWRAWRPRDTPCGQHVLFPSCPPQRTR
jgi:CubicO group peptidase (beta-lactamase class C family)